MAELMEKIIHYTACPVCGETALADVFSARDYTVSGKQFSVVACPSCTLRITQDVPGAADIGPYYKSESYISHTNTSKGLVNWLYQIVRRRTLLTKRRLIQKQTGQRRGKLLDYGCGTGAFARVMQQANWEVEGLEPDPDARAMAEKLYGLRVNDSSQLSALAPASFDAITLWHVLEHVHDLNSTVTQLCSLLKTGGKLIVAVPNYTSLDARVFGEHWAAYDVPRHLYHFSPAAMLRLMTGKGFKLHCLRPMWYDSFYVSILSSRYKNGKTKWPGALWTAVCSNFRTIGKPGNCSSVIYVLTKAV